MPQDNEPHLLKQSAYLQMLNTMDDLKGALNIPPKDRIAVVTQVLRAYGAYLTLEKEDGTAAGSTARKFEGAFQATDAARRGGDITGPTEGNGSTESDPLDAAEFWRSQPESP